MNIPESIFHKIMLFNSHPVADLFNKAFEDMDYKPHKFYNDWCLSKYNRHRNYGMSLVDILDLKDEELKTYWLTQWKKETNPKFCLGIPECDCYDCINSDDD